MIAATTAAAAALALTTPSLVPSASALLDPGKDVGPNNTICIAKVPAGPSNGSNMPSVDSYIRLGGAFNSDTACGRFEVALNNHVTKFQFHKKCGENLCNGTHISTLPGIQAIDIQEPFPSCIQTGEKTDFRVHIGCRVEAWDLVTD